MLSYLRGAWSIEAGHNPLGALSVVLMLALLVAQIVLGLFAVDVDGIESGPLSLYVSFDAGRAAARWHEYMFNALLWLVALHVLAIAYYLVMKRENLPAAMLHGTRSFPVEVQPVRRASATRFFLGVILAALLTWLVARAFQPWA